MNRFGLLGYPLSHSFSRTYFTKKFQIEGLSGYRYENFSFSDIEEAVSFLKNQQDLKGFNITIPHKQNILRFLNDSSPVCKEIRSCNCVKIDNGRWTGHNTDVIGFSESIRPLLHPWYKKALIFGTGGASKAVRYCLEKLGIACQLVSRSAKPDTLSYHQVNEDVMKSHLILVNTTPVGMFPHQEELLPIPYQFITSAHLAYDLIYNPEETSFLREAKKGGAIIKNGAEMLLIQAEESWRIWKKPESRKVGE